MPHPVTPVTVLFVVFAASCPGVGDNASVARNRSMVSKTREK